MLGGKMWVESNTDSQHDQVKGSVFYFTIPYAPGSGKELPGNIENS